MQVRRALWLAMLGPCQTCSETIFRGSNEYCMTGTMDDDMRAIRQASPKVKGMYDELVDGSQHDEDYMACYDEQQPTNSQEYLRNDISLVHRHV